MVQRIMTLTANNQEGRTMKTSRLFSVLFALLCMALLAACQKMEQEAPPEEVVKAADSLWILTVQATKDPNTKSPDTKALWLDDSGDKDVLNYYWKPADKVKVFKGGDCIGTMNVTPAEGDHPTTATLSGAINADNLSVGDELLLMLPRDTWDYNKQNGALNGTGSIEETYGFATATISVTAKDEATHTISISSSANFINQQSIYRFAFKLSGNSLSVKDFILNSANNSVVQSRTFGASGWASTCGSITVTMEAATEDLIYVSLRNENTSADTYTFILTASDDALILASKSIPASVLDVAGKLITAKKIAASKPDFGSSTETISDYTEIY